MILIVRNYITISIFENALYFNNLGGLKKKQKKYKEAIEAYTKAINLDKGKSNTFNNRGSVYFELKEYDKAENALTFIFINHMISMMDAFFSDHFNYKQERSTISPLQDFNDNSIKVIKSIGSGLSQTVLEIATTALWTANVF